MRGAWVVWAVLAVWCGYAGSAWDQGGKCHRTPFGTSSPKLPGDDGYKIKISGNPEKYVPGEVYTVSLEGKRTQYSVQKFIGFMLVVEASQTPLNLYGPQSVGTFQLYGDVLTMHSDDCPNAVVHTSSSAKGDIQVLWTAPPAGSGCVVFRATVQQNRDQWYMDDGELSKELCEEVQENEDMQPEVIYDCCACDEAKYEVTFEGMWSRHTHPKDFPSNEWLTHFSDIIGASHSAKYRVWEYGGYSSDGLRQVAEWGSTRALESELKEESDHIRTIIKARGLWHPNVNGKTFAVFRVDNRHHLMSLVSMLGPSPDWIVGVSALELCLRNCSWVEKKTLNLYPWDAGTDSGVTYESANSPTIPRQTIRRITNSQPNDPKSPFYDPTGLPMKPLARLTITRQRIYEKSCSDTHTYGGSSIYEITPDNDTDEDKAECRVGSWSLWSQCSATCGKGLRMRSRTYDLPMKASMMGCRRQIEEKEMCAAAETYCPGDSFGRDICATSEWSTWGSCSATCGKGFRMRNRRYLDRMGHKKCQKDTTEKEMCMADIPECTEVPEDESLTPECAVTQWSDWSPCLVTCGEGVHNRVRHYIMSHADHSSCTLKIRDRKPCYGARANCSIDPSEREEVCKQERQAGPCRGYFRRWYFDVGTQSCKEFAYGGCRGNRNNFHFLDECVNTCANLQETSHPHPADQFTSGGPKVDCEVSPWSDWSTCSVTCGRGRMEKVRKILVYPQNGGKRCPKKISRKKKCSAGKCNSHTLKELAAGLPLSGAPVLLKIPPHAEDLLEDFNPEDFKRAVKMLNEIYSNGFNGLQSMSLRREEPAVPYDFVPKEEHDAPLQFGDYREYISPALYNPPLIDEHLQSFCEGPDCDDGTKSDCVMGEWGPWSPCTHSCGGEALQQRSRTVIVTPKNGGTPCGDRFERRYCTLPPCPHTRG